MPHHFTAHATRETRSTTTYQRAHMTTNEAKEAASTSPGKHPSTPYKTLFFVTAPITAILAGACVWMGVQLASAPSASSSPNPTAAATAAGQAPANAETAAPSQTNQNNLTIMESFVRHQADDPQAKGCLLYTSPSPRDVEESRMPSSA